VLKHSKKKFSLEEFPLEKNTRANTYITGSVREDESLTPLAPV
jgi:hypothetical protein